MTVNKLPKVFIGAAAEEDDLADALKRVLEQTSGKLEVWTWRDVFDKGGASRATIEVIAALPTEYRFDFGVFFLGPDDETILRGVSIQTARGNVILEYGVFVGALGRERTFGFLPDSFETTLPNDLAGVTLLTWVVAHEESGNHTAAIRGNAGRLKEMILSRGPRQDSPSPVSENRPRSDGMNIPGSDWAPEDAWKIAAESGYLYPAQARDVIPGKYVVHPDYGIGRVRRLGPGEIDPPVTIKVCAYLTGNSSAKRVICSPLQRVATTKLTTWT